MGRKSVELKRLHKKIRKSVKRKNKHTVKDSGVGDGLSSPSDHLHNESAEDAVGSYESAEGKEVPVPRRHRTEMVPEYYPRHHYLLETEDICGLDMDVLEMQLDDRQTNNSNYESIEYIQDCRKRLMEKVDTYKAELEKLRTKEIERNSEHRGEIERIRSFYKAISYGLNRGGRMVQKSLCASSNAW